MQLQRQGYCFSIHGILPLATVSPLMPFLRQDNIQHSRDTSQFTTDQFAEIPSLRQ